MTLVKTTYTAATGKRKYASYSGTAGEVLQALASDKIKPEQIVEMKYDATFAVVSRL